MLTPTETYVQAQKQSQKFTNTHNRYFKLYKKYEGKKRPNNVSYHNFILFFYEF